MIISCIRGFLCESIHIYYLSRAIKVFSFFFELLFLIVFQICNLHYIEKKNITKTKTQSLNWPKILFLFYYNWLFHLWFGILMKRRRRRRNKPLAFLSISGRSRTFCLMRKLNSIWGTFAHAFRMCSPLYSCIFLLK